MQPTPKTASGKICAMKKPMANIHQRKMPIRRQFIAEWAQARGLKAADLVEQLGVDKSQVYRWFKGQMPQPAQQEAIAALFEIEPEALLRHPDDDWLSRFFAGRDAAEKDEIKRMIEKAWPPKNGTTN